MRLGSDMLTRAFKFMGRTDGSLQHRALRSGAWVGASSIGIAVLMFCRGIVLARLLSPDVFGLMAIALMATRFIEIFTETGFGAALIHRQQAFDEARDTAFTMMFLRGLGLSVLSVLIAPWVARFYEEPALASIVAVAGLSFILSGFQNLNTVALQKELDQKRLTYLELTGNLLRFVVTVGLAVWLRSVWALVYGQIAGAAIGTILSYLMVPGRPRLRFDRTIAVELYRYGRFITGLAIVVFLTRELDNALIGKLLGMEALGYYVVAYSLATLPSDYLSRFIAKVLFPMFSKLQAQPEALRAEYLRAMRVVTAFAVPVSVGMAVLAPDIVGVLYGGRWSEAAAPLRVLCAFSGFRALWLLNGYLYNAIGKPHIDFYMNLGRLLAMGILLYPLTVSFGVVGSAAAVALPMGAQFFAGLYLSTRTIGASAALTLPSLVAAAWQGLVIAAVLMSARFVLTAGPTFTLLCLSALGAALTVAFNRRNVRALVAMAGAR